MKKVEQFGKQFFNKYLDTFGQTQKKSENCDKWDP